MVRETLRGARKKVWHFCIRNCCYLLPYPERDTRARLLKNSALFFYVLVLLGFQLYVYRLSPRILGFATDIRVADLYRLTNQKRSAVGVGSLDTDRRLEQAALAKARDMFAKNYWAHYAPDGSTTPWQFMVNAGYAYKFAGENLAKDFDTSVSVIEAWIASPSHKANLLNGNYRDIGLVAINGTLLGEETTLVVQMFGTPQPTAVAKKPSPTIPPAPTTTPEEEEKPPEPVAITGPREEKVAISQPAALTEVRTAPLAQIVRTVNPISSPKTIPLGFGFVLMGLFALDEMVMLRGGLTRKEIRRTGENIAHVSLLGLLMALVWLTRTGGIL